jgi:hypothetical protein
MLGRYLNLGNPVSDHPLNRGLVAWWLPLSNNQGGSRLFDIKGGNTGTLTGGPTWTAGPDATQALKFDGTDDRVSVPVVVTTYPFTLAIYVRCNNTTSYGPSFTVGESGGAGHILGRIGFRGDQPGDYVEAVAAASGICAANSAGAFIANEWTAIVGVFVSGSDVTVYLNGVGTGSSGTASSMNAPTAMNIGSDASAGSFLAGSVALATAWNRALSASEAWQFYDQTRRGNPDTLRRYSRRFVTYSPPAAPAGDAVPACWSQYRRRFAG